jgi:integrase/recombinase XerC
MPTHPIFATYVALLEQAKRDDGTIDENQRVLTQFENWLRRERLDAMTVLRDEVLRYLHGMLDQSYAVSYVRRHLTIIGAAYRYAHGNGLVTADPTYSLSKLLPRVPDKLPLTFSPDELRRIHAALHPFRHDWQPAGNRDRVIFYTLLLTGMRKGELLSLRWEPQPGYSYIDFEGDQLVIFGKRDKQRFVPMHPILRDLLLRLRGTAWHAPLTGDTALIENIYHGPLRSESAGRIIRDLLTRAGVETNQTSHVFRKTLATNLARQNVRPDVIDSLFGWAPTTVRSRYYTGRVTEDQRAAVLMAYQDDPVLPEQLHLLKPQQKTEDESGLRRMVSDLQQLVALQAKQIAAQ